jgi:hypothetical protein
MLNVKGIDAIFQKGDGDDYKDKSRMYQDILIFGSTIQENEEFKLQDLAKYLLYNNEELRDRYFKSELALKKLNESSKIEHIMRRVKRNVNGLVVLRIMAEARQVKEERGTGLIPTFRFTPFGYFLSQIIQSPSSVNVEDKLYDLLYEGLFKVQTYSPSLVIFGSKWIKKMREKGEFGRFISIFKKVIDSKSIGSVEDFALILQRTVNLNFFHNPVGALLSVNTWEETVKELEPEIRKLFLYEQKLAIDVKMGSEARTLEYEKLRLDLIGDVELVALEGYCNECKQFVVVKMKILEYYRRLAYADKVVDGLAMACSKCNSRPHRPLRLRNLRE